MQSPADPVTGVGTGWQRVFQVRHTGLPCLPACLSAPRVNTDAVWREVDEERSRNGVTVLGKLGIRRTMEELSYVGHIVFGRRQSSVEAFHRSDCSKYIHD